MATIRNPTPREASTGSDRWGSLPALGSRTRPSWFRPCVFEPIRSSRIRPASHSRRRSRAWPLQTARVRCNAQPRQRAADAPAGPVASHEMDQGSIGTPRQPNVRPFWRAVLAGQSFDHWVRTSSEFEHILNYIAMNPVRAGLVSEPSQWPFSSWTNPTATG